MIAHDTKMGEVVLVMSEADAWDGSDARLIALQERFNAYVSFFLDGEMAETHPELVGKPVRIEVRCAHVPDGGAPTIGTRPLVCGCKPSARGMYFSHDRGRFSELYTGLSACSHHSSRCIPTLVRFLVVHQHLKNVDDIAGTNVAQFRQCSRRQILFA